MEPLSLISVQPRIYTARETFSLCVCGDGLDGSSKGIQEWEPAKRGPRNTVGTGIDGRTNCPSLFLSCVYQVIG